MLRLRNLRVSPRILFSTRNCQSKGQGTKELPLRSVRSWSRLGKAFNYPAPAILSSCKSVGLFGVQELTNELGFTSMRKKSLKRADEIIRTALESSRSEEIVGMFDNLSDTLCACADLSEFVRLTHPKESFRNAAEETSLTISRFVEKLNTNKDLHDILEYAITNNNAAMDEETKRVAQLFLFDFEQSGIHLDETKRSKFVQLQEASLVIGARFTQAASQPVIISINKCPDGIKRCFPVQGDDVKVNTLFLDSQSEKLREFAYRTYLEPIEEQLHALDILILARHKLAQVVGFPTFSHRALKGTMVQTPDNVKDFLELAAAMLEKPAKKELTILSNLKSFDNGNKLSDAMMPWDLQYYTSLAKSQSLKLNSSSLSEYFALGSCMEGLNLVFQSLYNITLEPVEAEKGELWADDVQKLRVNHKQEGLLGFIYCDFFVRDDKLHQDSHFTIRGGRLQSDGSYQLPVVVVVCNFPLPSPKSPSLLTHAMVENLFHEMGHAMHSMLARTQYQHVTGTRCSTDFAEVPSVLMEYFVWDPRVLSKFAKHYRTGHSLPEEMINKLSQSRNMFGAIEMQKQILYSMIDQLYHGNHPLSSSTTSILENVQNEYTVIPYVPGTAWQQRFSHLNGYGARYYSYLWSRAVASRIWHQCFAKDPFSQKMGERYRQTMLAHGGARDPNQLVEDMLGAKLTIHDMVQSLWDDLNASNPFYSA